MRKFVKKKSKNKITKKLLISYSLVLLITVGAFILFYKQLSRFNEFRNETTGFNDHIFLITETITDLYEVESLGRNLIKDADTIAFKVYKKKIEKINNSIDSLATKYPDTSQRIKINTINDLLRRKRINIDQLIEIYKKKNAETYYATAVRELKKIDPTFKNYTYKNRFRNLKSHQRNYLIKLLEYSKIDNENKLSNKTIDSIAASVTQVLLKLSKEERDIQKSIETKEDEILENERILTSQIRDMLTALEYKELQLYSQQAQKSKDILSKTYKILFFFALLSLLMALVFLNLINKDVKTENKSRIELQKAKNYTEKLLKNRERLMNMVTHDIRAPLNTIMGFLELLENSETSTKNQQYINQMQKSSDYMLNLVNELLDFSKVESGKLSIDKVSFQPNTVIENAIRLGIPTKINKDLKVSSKIDERLQGIFISDPYRIRQIAVNLISNAYKFTEKGYIIVTAHLDNPNSNNPVLKLSVSDSGVGIDTQQQESIFEAFKQNETTKTQNYKGFGLGLFITKNLIKLLDGELSVTSQLGKGSSFKCLIPIEKSTTSLIKNTSKKIILPNQNISVVIIDDEISQLTFLKAVLDQNKIKHTSFQNAKNALGFIIKNKPTIVLTDIQMPIMDGFELIKILKKHPKTDKIPVIALTGNNIFTPQSFKKAGFSSNLMKPYKPQQLLEIIASFINIEINTPEATKIQNKELELITPYYNLTDLVLFMDNDLIAVKKIIETFYSSTLNHVKEWEEAISFKNQNTIKYLAHKMLPMFMQIHAKNISIQLKEIDQREIIDQPCFYKDCEIIQDEILNILKNIKKFIA